MPQLEVQDLPKGWRPVAFRPPKINENFFEYGAVRFATRDFDTSDSRLILERIRQRIVLESTGENRTPNYDEWCRINGNFVRCKELDCTEQHAIWREIRIEEEARNDGANCTSSLWTMARSNIMAPLTEEQREKIMASHHAGKSQCDLAKIYEVVK